MNFGVCWGLFSLSKRYVLHFLSHSLSLYHCKDFLMPQCMAGLEETSCSLWPPPQATATRRRQRSPQAWSQRQASLAGDTLLTSLGRTSSNSDTYSVTQPPCILKSVIISCRVDLILEFANTLLNGQTTLLPNLENETQFFVHYSLPMGGTLASSVYCEQLTVTVNIVNV